MRYTVSGRVPSIISALLAVTLALAMQTVPHRTAAAEATPLLQTQQAG